MRVAFKTQLISSERSRAVNIFIPKEQDSHNINQFRGSNLLNVEGKFIFSIVVKQVTS